MTAPADRRLARILHLLAAGSREEGVAYAELARELDATVEEVIEDLQEVSDRAFYQPPGTADAVQILMDEARVRLFTGRRFRRPPRLSPREGMALRLALRVAAAGADEKRRARLLSLAERLGAREAAPIETATDGAASREVRPVLQRATREGHRCRLRYLKPGADAPDERTVHPYAVAYAEGTWYLVAQCERAGEVRTFRVDRILQAERTEGTFAVPEAFRLDDYLGGGRAFRPATEPVEVTVRYGPAVAPWIQERELGAESRDDGSVLVRHPAGDPAWLVRHVLRYGPDAEVLEPREMRAMVREAVERLAG
jgi:proteasome accessory factor C